MGCFSFMCKECGKAILSNSFSGQKTELFLLKDGEVIQHMSGEYDSYGRVFIDGTQDERVKHELRKSVQWNDPFPSKPLDPEKVRIIGEAHSIWHRVCNLMFDDDPANGIAAIHTKCYNGIHPTTRSDDDPNQGWGDDDELMGDCDPDKEFD